MSAPVEAQGACRVTGAEKLPAEAGGAAAICAAVRRAVAAQAPDLRYSAEVRVLSRTALAANLETAGRKLPELRFSVSDRELNPQAIGHFADSVANALADARQR
jgi:ADP-ribosylglycohydrolase